MTYDHWKTTNPDDEFLGPEPVMFVNEWHRGYTAWAAGRALNTNPYPNGSDQAYAWEEGWNTAGYEDFCGLQTGEEN